MKTPAGLQHLIDDGVIDEVIQSLKSGKEATVYVVRSGAHTRCAKVYRNMAQRSFQKRAQYQEGRKSRGSRETRAMSKSTTEIASGAVRDIEPELRELFTKIVERDPHEAVKMLEPYPDEFVVKMLELLNPAAAMKILQRFNLSRRETILATASSETTQQWMRNQTYPERTVGRLMQPPLAVFRPTTTIAEATEQIRRLAQKAIIAKRVKLLS